MNIADDGHCVSTIKKEPDTVTSNIKITNIFYVVENLFSWHDPLKLRSQEDYKCLLASINNYGRNFLW